METNHTCFINISCHILFNCGMPLHCELYFQVTGKVFNVRHLTMQHFKVKYSSSISNQIHFTYRSDQRTQRISTYTTQIHRCWQQLVWHKDQHVLRHNTTLGHKKFIYSHKYMESCRSRIILQANWICTVFISFHFHKDLVSSWGTLLLSMPSICYAFAVVA